MIDALTRLAEWLATNDWLAFGIVMGLWGIEAAVILLIFKLPSRRRGKRAVLFCFAALVTVCVLPVLAAYVWHVLLSSKNSNYSAAVFVGFMAVVVLTPWSYAMKRQTEPREP